MNKVKDWFEEASKSLKIFRIHDSEFIIYKGFKLTKNSDGFSILDTRYSNFYTPVVNIDMSFFSEYGFVKGADIIGFNRDSKRIVKYTKKIGRLYEKRKRFKKQMHLDERLNRKRIRNVNKHIDEFVDLLFFFQTKISQFNSKYKIE